MFLLASFLFCFVYAQFLVRFDALLAHIREIYGAVFAISLHGFCYVIRDGGRVRFHCARSVVNYVQFRRDNYFL